MCRWRARGSLFFGAAGFEHFEHAIGDEEAADDVAGGGDDGEGAEDGGESAAMFAGEDDGADDGDGVERVGEGHERGVQQRSDLADDFKTNESGEHENVEAGEQIHLHDYLFSSDAVTRGGSL